MTRRTHDILTACIASLVLVGCITMQTAGGSTVDLKPGDPAPAIALPEADDLVDTTGLTGRVMVLLFADAQQPHTRNACEEIMATLEDPHAGQGDVVWIVVLAKHGDADQFTSALSDVRPPDHIVVDSDRAAFGAYDVVVAPTTVVVDAKGRIVHTLAGFNYRYSDTLDYALQFARGQLTKDDFQLALSGELSESPDQQAVRAERIARLAYRLHRRGMFELAEQKYREAIELAPSFAGASIAYGAMLIKLGRLDDASRHYLSVLKAAPEHHDALVGLAHICIRRDPPDLTEAAQLLSKAIDQQPNSAPAHYLMGELHEAKGELEEAVRQYRIAASLALKAQWPAEPSLSEDSR